MLFWVWGYFLHTSEVSGLGVLGAGLIRHAPCSLNAKREGLNSKPYKGMGQNMETVMVPWGIYEDEDYTGNMLLKALSVHVAPNLFADSF